MDAPRTFAGPHAEDGLHAEDVLHARQGHVPEQLVVLTRQAAGVDHLTAAMRLAAEGGVPVLAL